MLRVDRRANTGPDNRCMYVKPKGAAQRDEQSFRQRRYFRFIALRPHDRSKFVPANPRQCRFLCHFLAQPARHLD